MPKNTDPNQSKLFIGKDGQLSLLNKTAEQMVREEQERKMAPVECLGQTFSGDTARREHYLKLLAEKLKDPEFRKTPGFPEGTDEDILRMSDPPYYTACPNPFLGEFVKAYGKPYDPSAAYHRDPFAVDSSVGKTDTLYKAHSYHTKVPHLAILPSLLHYTQPGDLVLDGFSGSGMTGVAVQFCAAADPALRREVESALSAAGSPPPVWGLRRAILNDLGPAATFVTAAYNLPIDCDNFISHADAILKDLESECGWMYETTHPETRARGRINFMVWSEVFGCPECAGELVFADEAVDSHGKVSQQITCPSCGKVSTKRQLVRCSVTEFDPFLGRPVTSLKRVPVLVDYSVGRRSFTKVPDASDRAILDRIMAMAVPQGVPVAEFPFDDMWEAPRLKGKGITHVHQLFVRRTLHVMASAWSRIERIESPDVRRHLRALLHHQVVNASLRNTYRPVSSFGNRALTSAYYVSSMAAEANVLSLMGGTLKRIARAMGETTLPGIHGSAVMISTQSSTALSQVPDATIDYVFTDPPFGDNFAYSELNFVAEAWHRVMTDARTEAVVDRSKVNQARQKGLSEYTTLMAACFAEYARVLKPGRWITVVFSNSRNSVWRGIQEALGMAGFVVADVRTLDKQQLSFKQVTSAAVKQDLVISAYKPSEALNRTFQLGRTSSEGAWAFVREHLGNLPVFIKQGSAAQVVADRTGQLLFDRMTAFHVQRGMAVPLSAGEFLEGLGQRFAERDGMFFLPDQLAEYDRKRMTVSELEQLDLFVSDESSAIQWLRRTLHEKPQSFQDLQPQFMQETRSWDKHEKPLDLRVLLEENFLCYDGNAEVPSQIHRYLSSNMKDSRNLAKEDASLRAKAADRWYVPDPKKATDLEKLREKSLLKEFETYNAPGGKKLKVFRLEAVRAGFKKAWEAKDYKTIIEVAKRIPEDVLQEDQKLVMWYDNALTRAGVE